MTLQRQTPQSQAATEYFCIVPDENRFAVLVIPDGMRWTLPRVTPFQDRREFLPDDVGAIGRTASRLLGARSIVLRHVLDAGAIQVCELETLRPVKMQPDWSWARADELEHMEIAVPPVVLEALVRWFKEVHQPPHRGRAPWEQRGWLLRTERQLAGELQRRNWRALDVTEQVKAAWNVSTVLKLRTDHGDLYFKESWPKPPAEGRVIARLRERWPEEVPSILAATPDWHGFLMPDFGGTSLGAIAPGNEWLAAVRRFAEIQVAESDHRDGWLQICPDLRPSVLVKTLETMLANKPLLFQGHHALHEDEYVSLQAYVPRIREMCQRLESGPVPMTLHHEDFRAGNIVLKNTGFLFYDWAWCAVTHPFFSLGYFFTRGLPRHGQVWDWRLHDDDAIRHALAKSYLEPFTRFAPMPELLDLFLLTRQLQFLYRSVAMFQSLPHLEPGTPWFAATVPMVPRFMRFILNQIALVEEMQYGG